MCEATWSINSLFVLNHYYAGQCSSKDEGLLSIMVQKKIIWQRFYCCMFEKVKTEIKGK
jgi:hypothetical protein